jgi:hypothetical protein
MYTMNVIFDRNMPPPKQMAGGKSTLQLKDNRPKSSIQKKQVDAMAEGGPMQRARSNSGLPDQLKSGIENLSGHSMDDVKVHYNSAKPAQLNAHAYAQGTDIHIASGQEKHLPHEAWHVVQQKQGRVQPTMQMKGKVNVNDEKGLEREADVMGAKAVTARPKYNYTTQNKSYSTIADAKLTQFPAQMRRVIQMVKFLSVKRIANHGSLYTGIGGAGPPALAHNGGTNWWGPKATARVYAANGGTMWQALATRNLNLVGMSTAKGVKKAMRETVRRRGAAGLSPALQNALAGHDFAYAVSVAVANIAEMCSRYARREIAARGTGRWTNNPYVNQVNINTAVNNAGNAANLPLWVGSVIQQFADHNSPNSVQLDSPAFLANPNAYCVLRKDNTPTDATFANALLQDLNNNQNLIQGLYVPAGMKFGGWTGTKHEILIQNSTANLALQPNAVAANGPEPDMRVTNKTLGVDDSKLARAWRAVGGNG